MDGCESLDLRLLRSVVRHDRGRVRRPVSLRFGVTTAQLAGLVLGGYLTDGGGTPAVSSTRIPPDSRLARLMAEVAELPGIEWGHLLWQGGIDTVRVLDEDIRLLIAAGVWKQSRKARKLWLLRYDEASAVAGSEVVVDTEPDAHHEGEIGQVVFERLYALQFVDRVSGIPAAANAAATSIRGLGDLQPEQADALVSLLTGLDAAISLARTSQDRYPIT